MGEICQNFVRNHRLISFLKNNASGFSCWLSPKTHFFNLFQPGSGTFSTLGQVPPRTFSTLDLFHPELLPLWDIFHPGTFFTLGPAVAKGWGGKSSGWIRSKSSGWKRSGVENVRGGTCPRVEKVPEPCKSSKNMNVKNKYLCLEVNHS